MSDIKASQRVRTEDNGDVVINISDPTTPSQVAGVDANGDLCTKSKLTDSSGTAIDGSNPLPVAFKKGTAAKDYDDSGAIAVDASADHDYAPGAAGDVIGLLLASSGAAKYDLLIGPASSEVLVGSFFTTPASPSLVVNLPAGFAVGATDNIKVTKTNDDDEPQCMYSTIIFEAN